MFKETITHLPPECCDVLSIVETPVWKLINESTIQFYLPVLQTQRGNKKYCFKVDYIPNYIKIVNLKPFQSYYTMLCESATTKQVQKYLRSLKIILQLKKKSLCLKPHDRSKNYAARNCKLYFPTTTMKNA
jgi:hypothetical protein